MAKRENDFIDPVQQCEAQGVLILLSCEMLIGGWGLRKPVIRQIPASIILENGALLMHLRKEKKRKDNNCSEVVLVQRKLQLLAKRKDISKHCVKGEGQKKGFYPSTIMWVSHFGLWFAGQHNFPCCFGWIL